jgi:hypothetical protein
VTNIGSFPEARASLDRERISLIYRPDIIIPTDLTINFSTLHAVAAHRRRATQIYRPINTATIYKSIKHSHQYVLIHQHKSRSDLRYVPQIRRHVIKQPNHTPIHDEMTVRVRQVSPGRKRPRPNHKQMLKKYLLQK